MEFLISDHCDLPAVWRAKKVKHDLIERGYREALDGRLCRPDSEQRPLVSNFSTMAIVKLCCHNFTQIANLMIFLCLLFLIDLLTYPY